MERFLSRGFARTRSPILASGSEAACAPNPTNPFAQLVAGASYEDMPFICLDLSLVSDRLNVDAAQAGRHSDLLSPNQCGWASCAELTKVLPMAILAGLHILAAVIWVGGMFFAYNVLRPSAGPLASAERLALWHRVFSRFFPWVWVSIVLLLISGYGMIFAYFGGFSGAALHVHIMQGTGIVMTLLFFHLFFGPWRRFGQAIEIGALPEAGKELHRIRRTVAINLVLGVLTAVVGTSGRFW